MPQMTIRRPLGELDLRHQLVDLSRIHRFDKLLLRETGLCGFIKIEAMGKA